MKQKTVTDSHDIALHFNPRLKENIIIRNTYQNSQWGDEERNGGSPLKAGCDLTLYIVCEERGYRIYINDSEYTFYSHRLPPTSITHLRIKGLLTLCSVIYKSTSVSEMLKHLSDLSLMSRVVGHFCNYKENVFYFLRLLL